VSFHLLPPRGPGKKEGTVKISRKKEWRKKEESHPGRPKTALLIIPADRKGEAGED